MAKNLCDDCRNMVIITQQKPDSETFTNEFCKVLRCKPGFMVIKCSEYYEKE